MNVNRYLDNFLRRIHFDSFDKLENVNKIKVKVCMPDREDKEIILQEDDLKIEIPFDATMPVSDVLEGMETDRARKGLNDFIEELTTRLKSRKYKKLVMLIGAGFESHIVDTAAKLKKELLPLKTLREYEKWKIFFISCLYASMGEDDSYRILLEWLDKKKRYEPSLYTENYTRGFGDWGSNNIHYLAHNEAKVDNDVLIIEMGYTDHRFLKRKLIDEMRKADFACLYGIGTFFLTESSIINGLIGMCEKPSKNKRKEVFIHDFRSDDPGDYDKDYRFLTKILPTYAKTYGFKLDTFVWGVS